MVDETDRWGLRFVCVNSEVVKDGTMVGDMDENTMPNRGRRAV